MAAPFYFVIWFVYDLMKNTYNFVIALLFVISASTDKVFIAILVDFNFILLPRFRVLFIGMGT